MNATPNFPNERYNDNAYKINLPCDNDNVSNIFNVKDLSPYLESGFRSEVGSFSREGR